jgi:hypothetical protein
MLPAVQWTRLSPTAINLGTRGRVPNLPRCARTSKARPPATRIPERWGAALVVLGFALGRLWYRAQGVTLDWSTITYFDQLIDPALLREHLAQSLLYMSGQPPLYNVLTAIALKLSPTAPATILAPVFLAVGLYIGLALYVILVRLRIAVAVAAVVAIAVVNTPTFLLYENWYFYPHLNVAWLVGGVAWLAQSRGRPGPAMALAAAHFGGLVLTRSLFHPIFLVAMALVTALCVAPALRRRALLGFVLPALLVFAWCAKNLVLFGMFGTSAWASRNLAHSVAGLVGPERVAAEIRKGHLSAAATHDPFEPGDANIALFHLTPKTTGIPILDDVYKSTRSFHSVSYNHWSFPATRGFYWQDVRHLVAVYPATYLRGLLTVALPSYFRPVDDDNFFFRNRVAVPRAAAGFAAFEASPVSRAVFAFGLLLALVAAVAPATPRPLRIVLVPSFVAIAWVSLVGLMGELGENNRFRYKVLWLVWVLAVAGYGLGLSYLSHRIRMSRLRRAAARALRG